MGNTLNELHFSIFSIFVATMANKAGHNQSVSSPFAS